MELAVLLSNRRRAEEVRGLVKLVHGLASTAEQAEAPPRSSTLKPRRGATLAAIKAVLGEHPEGLRAFEIGRLVERRLAFRVPRSTVKATLAGRPEFQRIARGLYRLRF